MHLVYFGLLKRVLTTMIRFENAFLIEIAYSKKSKISHEFDISEFEISKFACTTVNCKQGSWNYNATIYGHPEYRRSFLISSER